MSNPYREAGTVPEDPEIAELRKGLRDLDSRVDILFWIGVGLLIVAVVSIVSCTAKSSKLSTALEKRSAPTGECRDAVVEIETGSVSALCPYDGQSIDTAWMGGNRALCRCNKRDK